MEAGKADPLVVVVLLHALEALCFLCNQHLSHQDTYSAWTAVLGPVNLVPPNLWEPRSVAAVKYLRPPVNEVASVLASVASVMLRLVYVVVYVCVMGGACLRRVKFRVRSHDLYLNN